MLEDQENLEGDEALWWVRYLYKRDLLRDPRDSAHRNNAFFYASNVERARKKVDDWLHNVKRDEIVVQEIEQVPLGFNLQVVPGLLQELPADAVVLQGQQVEHVIEQEGEKG